MNIHKQIFPLMGVAAIGGLSISSCGQDGQEGKPDGRPNIT